MDSQRHQRIYQSNFNRIGKPNPMIIDMHAHALAEGFLSDLCTHPIAGMSCQKDGHDNTEAVARRSNIEQPQRVEPTAYSDELIRAVK